MVFTEGVAMIGCFPFLTSVVGFGLYLPCNIGHCHPVPVDKKKHLNHRDLDWHN